MITAENLTKVYGNYRAIDGISFEVAQGEILGFLGPNGAGKTTTMRILACYTPATSGRATVARCDVARDSFEARKNLGYLPEHAPAYGSMKVRSYLKFMAEAKRLASATRRSYLDQAIEECGLGGVANRTISNLSKGYRQRVGLAQAILGDPAVLILDEPTVGLDPVQIAEIRQMIKKMAGHRTVLLSSHILPEISMLCQRVVVIDRGKVVASGTPQKLVSSLQTEESPIHVTAKGESDKIRARIGNISDVGKVEIEKRLGEGVCSYLVYAHPKSDPRGEIAGAIVEGGWELLELGAPGYSLEEVFIRVIASSEGRQISEGGQGGS